MNWEGWLINKHDGMIHAFHLSFKEIIKHILLRILNIVSYLPLFVSPPPPFPAFLK